jgi:ABC-type uncharacterized transport system permease subunit
MDDRPLIAYRRYLPQLEALVAVAGTFAASAAFLLIAGKNPLEALLVLVQSTLMTPEGFAEVVVRSVPLTLTGLGIAVAFRAGVYNIGGDGQFILGTIATALVALYVPLGAFTLPLALLAGFAAGGLFAAIPGELRARFNASEIIVTIMLNYIAFQLVGWLLRGPLQERAHCSRLWRLICSCVIRRLATDLRPQARACPPPNTAASEPAEHSFRPS